MTSRRGGAKRQLAWFYHRSTTVLTANGILVATLVDSSVNLLLTEATITRMVFRLHFDDSLLDISAQATEVSVGIVLANEQAVAVGASALPDPLSPGGVDWMYWTWKALEPRPFIAVAGQTDHDSVFMEGEVREDIRAQRKMRENNMDLVMLVGEESGVTPTVRISCSTLLRLG